MQLASFIVKHCILQEKTARHRVVLASIITLVHTCIQSVISMIIIIFINNYDMINVLIVIMYTGIYTFLLLKRLKHHRQGLTISQSPQMNSISQLRLYSRTCLDMYMILKIRFNLLLHGYNKYTFNLFENITSRQYYVPNYIAIVVVTLIAFNIRTTYYYLVARFLCIGVCMP